MIIVTSTDTALTVYGHAGKRGETEAIQVCAAVTALVEALASYQAPLEKRSGKAHFDVHPGGLPRLHVDFVVNALRLLAEDHPKYVRFVNERTRR